MDSQAHFSQAFCAYFRCLLLATLLFPVACASSSPPAAVVGEQSVGFSELLKWGRHYSKVGQGLRAEQYFIAAQERGADPELVFELLVENCLRGGRVGSALRLVKDQLSTQPESSSLHQVAASLFWALGQEPEAWRHIEILEAESQVSAEVQFFLAEFYAARPEQSERARRSLRLFLERFPNRPESVLARATLREVERQRSTQSGQASGAEMNLQAAPVASSLLEGQGHTHE